MNRKQLYKISIFLSVIGLTLMYASSQYLEPEKAEIGEIDESWTGKTLRINGEAANVTRTENHLFMDLEDSAGSIMVVQFDSQTSVDEGEELEVSGHVELYEGELEIVAREISKN